MKFPVPKTLCGALSPILLINWAFGIGVIEYPMGRPRLMISIFWSIVNLLIYLGFWKMASLSVSVTFQESGIAAQSYRMNTSLCVAFIASSMCVAKINAKDIKGVFTKLSTMNDRLVKLGISNAYKSLFMSQIIQLGVAFSSMFSLMGLNFKYVGFQFLNKSSRVGFIMSSHYFLAFAFVVEYTFVVGIRYFGDRFRRLNELLVETSSPEKSRPRETWRTGKQLPYYPSVVDESHRYDSIAIMRAAKQRWLLYLIRETRKIHRGLCRAAMESNKAFGIQMLFSIAISFGMTTGLLYSFYLALMTPSRHGPADTIHIFSHLIFASTQAVRVFMIIDACETTSCEANRTGELISTLLEAASSDEDARDEKQKSRIV